MQSMGQSTIRKLIGNGVTSVEGYLNICANTSFFCRTCEHITQVSVEVEVIIRYVLVFLLLYFSRGSLYILLLMYKYIYEPLTLR
jgi:hypothetical protein